MKKSLFVLAMLCFGFFSFAPSFVNETRYIATYADDSKSGSDSATEAGGSEEGDGLWYKRRKDVKDYEADYNKADLKTIFPAFFTVKSLEDFAKKIMIFLGATIIFASVLGFMVGGGFWVFSNGDEGMVSKGKDLMIASIIGLFVTMLSAAIVMLVQSVLYNI